ncbi:MAG: hypothetical protein Q4G52_08545 [Clostridia bacterium]|nr:hypothetical protein [Clostridia bacterium]
MCVNRFYDAVSIAVSILLGIVMTVFAAFNLLTAGLLTPIFGGLLAAFALLLLTLGAASLLRQNESINCCVCRRGIRLLIPALLLLALSAFTLFFALTNLIIGLILAFLLYTLIALTFFALYGYLRCLIDCRDSQEGCAR